jgi:hypothetical protein
VCISLEDYHLYYVYLNLLVVLENLNMIRCLFYICLNLFFGKTLKSNDIHLKKYTKYPDTSSLWFLRKQLFPHKVETMCGSGYFGFQIITKTYFCRVLPKDHFR